MRVWALASCGGLLALAACSADQTNTANPNSPPSDADGLAQGQKSPTTAPPSPLARPEMPSQQALSARPRLNPAGANRTAPQPQAQPQADQLRARLQRLRAQEGTRLAASAPVAAAPIPTTAKVVASPIPQPGAPILLQADSTPSPSRDSRLAIVPPPNRTEPSPLLATPTPLPSPQPTVIKADVESSGTTADLQPVVAASIASNYPVAPLRHQGHSARHSARSASPQVLVPPPTSQLIAASARLHGSTALAQVTQPGGATAEPASGAEATLVSDLTPDSAAPLASAPEAVILREHATAQSRADDPLTLASSRDFSGAAAGAHRQESTAPPRTERRLPRQDSLAPRLDSRAAEDQNLGAIALPESLPLHSSAPRIAAPRLSPQRPQLSPAQPAVAQPADSQLATTDRTTTEPTAAPLAVPAGGHLSPTDQNRLYLVPAASQSPKGLTPAHCPSTRAPLPLDRLVNGAIAAQPSFSGHNQSMTSGKEAPTALCWGNVTTQSVALETDSAAAPAPHSLEFSAAEVADLDLETLAPTPLAD